jgi:hypothetical protein
MLVHPSINWCVRGILLPWTLGPSTGTTNLLNCIYTLLWSYHTFLPSIPHSTPLLCVHPASVGRKAASLVLTAPSPPTSPEHKSSPCHPCFSAPSGSKVTALDLLLHRILYSFVLLSRALCSFTSNLAIVNFLDPQMEMHLLVLEFMAIYLRGT